MIERVDAARIFMMHRFGGVYADLDVEAVRDPSPLFSGGHDLVFFYQLAPRSTEATIDPINASSPKLGTISNALMASRPGHPFWLFLAERMIKFRAAAQEVQSDIPNMDVYMATGPSMLSKALAEYQAEHTEAKVAIFSRRYWSPFSWGLKADPCEVLWECKAQFPDAYLVSHWTRSWILCRPGMHSGACVSPPSLLQEAADTNENAGAWCP
mmetsp:Transcript_35652/g.107573  ORF Transcript_35652/g.107573 Transcript_35652/m.107573 type:complete len:212 (-) Transcript_35652:11-646(-)